MTDTRDTAAYDKLKSIFNACRPTDRPIAIHAVKEWVIEQNVRNLERSLEQVRNAMPVAFSAAHRELWIIALRTALFDAHLAEWDALGAFVRTNMDARYDHLECAVIDRARERLLAGVADQAPQPPEIIPDALARRADWRIAWPAWRARFAMAPYTRADAEHDRGLELLDTAGPHWTCASDPLVLEGLASGRLRVYSSHGQWSAHGKDAVSGASSRVWSSDTVVALERRYFESARARKEVKGGYNRDVNLAGLDLRQRNALRTIAEHTKLREEALLSAWVSYVDIGFGADAHEAWEEQAPTAIDLAPVVELVLCGTGAITLSTERAPRGRLITEAECKAQAVADLKDELEAADQRARRLATRAARDARRLEALYKAARPVGQSLSGRVHELLGTVSRQQRVIGQTLNEKRSAQVADAHVGGAPPKPVDAFEERIPVTGQRRPLPSPPVPAHAPPLWRALAGRGFDVQVDEAAEQLVLRIMSSDVVIVKTTADKLEYLRKDCLLPPTLTLRNRDQVVLLFRAPPDVQAWPGVFDRDGIHWCARGDLEIGPLVTLDDDSACVLARMPAPPWTFLPMKAAPEAQSPSAAPAQAESEPQREQEPVRLDLRRYGVLGVVTAHWNVEKYGETNTRSMAVSDGRRVYLFRAPAIAERWPRTLVRADDELWVMDGSIVTMPLDRDDLPPAPAPLWRKDGDYALTPARQVGGWQPRIWMSSMCAEHRHFQQWCDTGKLDYGRPSLLGYDAMSRGIEWAIVEKPSMTTPTAAPLPSDALAEETAPIAPPAPAIAEQQAQPTYNVGRVRDLLPCHVKHCVEWQDTNGRWYSSGTSRWRMVYDGGRWLIGGNITDADLEYMGRVVPAGSSADPTTRGPVAPADAPATAFSPPAGYPQQPPESFW